MAQVEYLQKVGYPVQFSVDYPDRRLSRLSTAFRILLVIPIWIVLTTVSGYVVFTVPSHTYGITYIVTGRYPRALFGFVEGVIRWNVRVTAYTLTLVTDRYPPFQLSS